MIHSGFWDEQVYKERQKANQKDAQAIARLLEPVSETAMAITVRQFEETYWLGLAMFVTGLAAGITAIHTGQINYLAGLLGALLVVTLDNTIPKRK